MKKKLLLLLILVLAVGSGVLAYYDMQHGILDTVLSQQKTTLKTVDQQQKSAEVLLRSRVLAGFSMGMLFLLGGAYLLPIFLRNVDTKQYHHELWNGILTATVFLGMTSILESLQPKNYVTYGLAIIVVVTLTLKVLSLTLGKTRKTVLTAIVGAIVSGLLFSALIHFVTVGVDYSTEELRRVLPSVPGSK